MPRHPIVYIATLFSAQEQACVLADWLIDQGINVQCRWVYGGEEGLTLTDIALLDLEDVDACNVVVSMTLPKGTASTGGGRHVEFGYAYGRQKRCILLGPREVIFHHLPDVEQVDTREELLDLLLGGYNGKKAEHTSV